MQPVVDHLPGDKPVARDNYHHGDLRNAILKAAGDIVHQEGMSALSLRRVADVVNVSRTAPYRHFKSKEALLAGLATEGFKMLKRSVSEARAQFETDTIAQLFAGCEAYVRLGTENPCLYRLMFGQGWPQGEQPELESAGQAAFQELVIGIADMQAAGTAKSKLTSNARLSNAAEQNAEAINLAMVVWSAMHGLVHLWIDGKASRFEEHDLSEQLNMLLNSLLVGIKP